MTMSIGPLEYSRSGRLRIRVDMLWADRCIWHGRRFNNDTGAVLFRMKIELRPPTRLDVFLESEDSGQTSEKQPVAAIGNFGHAFDLTYQGRKQPARCKTLLIDANFVKQPSGQ